MTLWATTSDEQITLLIAGVVAEILLLAWIPYAFPRGPTGLRGQDWEHKLVELERDRVLAAAKGIAATAAGFLTATVLALAKDEITVQVSGWSLLGCVLGVVGALLLAAVLSASTRDYTQSYP